jgi:hypothetical protein
VAVGGKEQQAEKQVEPLSGHPRGHAAQGVGQLRKAQAGALGHQLAGQRPGFEDQPQHEAHARADGQFTGHPKDDRRVKAIPLRHRWQQRRQRHAQRPGQEDPDACRHRAGAYQRHGHQQRADAQHGPQDRADHREGLLAIDDHLRCRIHGF